MAWVLYRGSLVALLVCTLCSCLPSDTCMHDRELCMQHCNYEPAQAHDEDVQKYEPKLNASPKGDARTACENSCQRCRKTDPAATQTPSKPPTPTGY